MGNKVIVRKNGEEETFTDVLGHNVGNGAIQVLFMEGGSRVIFNPDDIDIILDEEATDQFKKTLDMQMQAANESVSNQEKAQVVPINH